VAGFGALVALADRRSAEDQLLNHRHDAQSPARVQTGSSRAAA
jgi:hypothetical protein